MNDIEMKQCFPILAKEVYGKQLVYLDSAATTQKPQSVIDAMTHFLTNENANVHRGVHFLAECSTNQYDQARIAVQRFINAPNSDEIIFVNGTTDGINLIASTYAKTILNEGDEIIVTVMEHHSNLLPWMILAKNIGAKIRTIPIDNEGNLDIENLSNSMNDRTKILAITHASNVLGTINPIKDIIKIARKHNICVVVDGAQAVAHIPVDVVDIDCDFYVFSSHKMYGPTGIGVVYGKKHLLALMDPYRFGGGMVLSVGEQIIYNDVPHKFEAGTPNVMGAVGLMAAIKFIEDVGISELKKSEDLLYRYTIEGLSSIPQLRVLSFPKKQVPVISFVMEGYHPHDIGTILDRYGVAIRTGHHCAQPLMKALNVTSTARISIGCYNTKEDIDIFLSGMMNVTKVLRNE